MILSNGDILDARAQGLLDIVPFDKSLLQPASYDLTAGAEAVTSGARIDLSRERYVKITRGSIAVIATAETVKLSAKVAGRFGLRSHFAREGLVLLSGPQIDPGFEGILSITVFNAGVQDITVEIAEHLATIEFAYLKSPSTEKYSGAYLGQDKIPIEEVRRLTESKARSFSEIERLLDRFQFRIELLMGVIVEIVIGVVIGGLLAAVVALVLAIALD